MYWSRRSGCDVVHEVRKQNKAGRRGVRVRHPWRADRADRQHREAWVRRIHPDDRTSLLTEFERCKRTREKFIAEYRLLNAGGCVVWFHDEAQLMPANDGTPGFMQGVMLDITERKRAEAALQAAEAKYRSIVENAVEGIYQTTPDGRVLTANRALARLLGYATPEALVNSVTDAAVQVYVDPRDRATIVRQLLGHGQDHHRNRRLYHQQWQPARNGLDFSCAAHHV